MLRPLGRLCLAACAACQPASGEATALRHATVSASVCDASASVSLLQHGAQGGKALALFSERRAGGEAPRPARAAPAAGSRTEVAGSEGAIRAPAEGDVLLARSEALSRGRNAGGEPPHPGGERFAAETQAASVESFVDHFPTFLEDNLLLAPGARLPQFMRRFDWVVGWPLCQDPKLRPGSAKSVPDCRPQRLRDHTWEVGAADPFAHGIADPRTVLVSSERLDDLLAHAAAHLGSGRGDRSLLIGGDWNLTWMAAQRQRTVQEMVAGIRRFFPHVWIVAKDVDVPGVMTMPVPLESLYIRGSAGPAAVAAVAAASLKAKERAVLAAWGVFCPDVETDCSDEGRFACTSRASARAWATQPAAAALGVEVMAVPPEVYWEELARSRFLLSPNGHGIQSTKNMEALAVLTVPIVQRGGFPVYDELVRRGFPLVVVDSWDEITAAKLDGWWSDLSPRLESFRTNCLTTDGFWSLFTGQTESCA